MSKKVIVQKYTEAARIKSQIDKLTAETAKMSQELAFVTRNLAERTQTLNELHTSLRNVERETKRLIETGEWLYGETLIDIIKNLLTNKVIPFYNKVVVKMRSRLVD